LAPLRAASQPLRRQVLHLGGVLTPAAHKYFANEYDRCRRLQSRQSQRVDGGDVDPCNTCHAATLLLKDKNYDHLRLLYSISPALLVARLRANYAHDAVATDDLQFTGSSLLMLASHLLLLTAQLFSAEHNRACSNRTGQFDVTFRPAGCVCKHTHLPGDMTQNYMTIFQLDPERRIRQRTLNLTLHLNHILFCHLESALVSACQTALEIAFFSKLSY